LTTHYIFPEQYLEKSLKWTLGEKDGGITRDDMRLLFAEDPDFVNDLNTRQHRLPLTWFVENIDEVFSEFMEQNIEIADALRTHPNGLREFALIDIRLLHSGIGGL
jgi:hypothetical protein